MSWGWVLDSVPVANFRRELLDSWDSDRTRDILHGIG